MTQKKNDQQQNNDIKDKLSLIGCLLLIMIVISACSVIMSTDWSPCIPNAKGYGC